MATPLIAYPFQLAPSGAVATAEQDTDTQLAHEVACAVLTAPQERPLATDYGIADPTFSGFEADALRLSVDSHGPPVTIDAVDVRFVDARTQDVVVYFSTGSEV